MRKEYGSLIEFYRDSAGDGFGNVALEDIDALIAKIEAEKNAEVIELPAGGVTVQIPTRRPQNTFAKSNTAKPGTQNCPSQYGKKSPPNSPKPAANSG
jgi:hypothetical protein